MWNGTGKAPWFRIPFSHVQNSVTRTQLPLFQQKLHSFVRFFSCQISFSPLNNLMGSMGKKNRKLKVSETKPQDKRNFFQQTHKCLFSPSFFLPFTKRYTNDDVKKPGKMFRELSPFFSLKVFENLFGSRVKDFFLKNTQRGFRRRVKFGTLL